jgi:regulator of protease activity HflC (stomatin/prohibitin superfamily)
MSFLDKETRMSGVKLGALAVMAFCGLLVGMVLVFGSWTTVSAGHRGVVLRMGAVSGEVMQEGFNTKAPWLDSVVEIEVRTQKEVLSTEGASKDLQIVTAEIALNFRPDETKVADIYQKFGDQYKERIIDPVMQESIKAVIAEHTAVDLVASREVVRQSIQDMLTAKLADRGIIVEDVNLVDLDFSQSFNNAIEAKVTAEQNALAAKNKLEQIKYEVEQQVAEAKGKAEAMEIESAALAENPQIIELRALEKWDGILPRVTGGAMPFIQLDMQARN